MPETNEHLEFITKQEAIIIGKMESMSVKNSGGLVLSDGTHIAFTTEEKLPKVKYEDVADLCAKFRKMQAIIQEAHHKMKDEIAEKLAPFFK